MVNAYIKIGPDIRYRVGLGQGWIEQLKHVHRGNYC